MNVLDLITLGVAGFVAIVVANMLVQACVLRQKASWNGHSSLLLFGLPFLVVADLLVRAAS